MPAARMPGLALIFGHDYPHPCGEGQSTDQIVHCEGRNKVVRPRCTRNVLVRDFCVTLWLRQPFSS
jgi:hypothetical protein